MSQKNSPNSLTHIITDSNSNSRQKKKSKKKDKDHQKSLSPLSKRLGDVVNVDPGYQFNQFEPSSSSHHLANVDDYEMKVY